jgi:hypothetical protein
MDWKGYTEPYMQEKEEYVNRNRKEGLFQF